MITAFVAALIFSLSCNRNDDLADAYGNFEVDETVVSSLMAGEIMQFDIKEGSTYQGGQLIGYIDTTDLQLLKPELLANRKATASKIEGITTQIEVLEDQLANQKREQKRISNLVKAGAATVQQLDNIDGQIDVINSQIKNAKSQFASIIAQLEGIDAKVMQLEEKIRKSRIINPVTGIVLTKLTDVHEFTMPGKPLYTIANIEEMDLRAYISGSQLSSVLLGETVTIKIDGANNEMIEYQGEVVWISSEAEFTPKTIQTKEERVDLMYAIKVRVKNDGRIKIGMPGEMWLNAAD